MSRSWSKAQFFSFAVPHERQRDTGTEWEWAIIFFLPPYYFTYYHSLPSLISYLHFYSHTLFSNKSLFITIFGGCLARMNMIFYLKVCPFTPPDWMDHSQRTRRCSQTYSLKASANCCVVVLIGDSGVGMYSSPSKKIHATISNLIQIRKIQPVESIYSKWI